MKSKQTKQKEALERREKYESLTKKEKLNLIEKRPGNSFKEVKKINKKGQKMEDWKLQERIWKWKTGNYKKGYGK